MKESKKDGTLYLLPVPLVRKKIEEAIPVNNLRIIQGLSNFIVENIRTARRNLRDMGYTASLDDEHFFILDKHTLDEELYPLIQPLLDGKNVGLMSESGLPCIADPGSRIVQVARAAGITVRPLTGPSSIMLGLMASGFNGQEFRFHGYLPVKGKELKQSLLRLEKEAMAGITQIFIEAPYRNQKLLDEILRSCNEDTLVCIASELTADTEWVNTMNVRQWKNQRPDIHKKNTIFLIGKYF